MGKSKKELESEIEEFFKNIKSKNSEEIKKIKKRAMSKNIRLGEKKRLFCKNCFEVYNNPKIRIRNGIKIVECKNCKYVRRWKINSS